MTSSSKMQCHSGATEVVFVAPALMGGGAERVACTIAEYCLAQGIRFTFLLTKSGNIDYDLPDGVTVEDVSRDGSITPFGQIAVIRHAMNRHPHATFLSFLPYQNMYTILAGIGQKNRVVVSVRNDPSYDFAGNKVLEAVRNRLYAHADAVVFQTHEEAEAFPLSVQRIGTFILNPLSPLTPKVYEGEREMRVSTSGRLTAQKNYPMAIKAFARFSESHPDYTFDIYGAARAEFDSESMDSELRELVVSLGIEERVRFHGFLKNANEQIRKSSMFIMASKYEGLSNSMLEALSMGLPCICTRCGGGGPQMVIRDTVNGFLVDVDDIDAMADVMSRIADNPMMASAISQEAAKLREQIDPSKIGEQWLSVL